MLGIGLEPQDRLVADIGHAEHAVQIALVVLRQGDQRTGGVLHAEGLRVVPELFGALDLPEGDGAVGPGLGVLLGHGEQQAHQHRREAQEDARRPEQVFQVGKSVFHDRTSFDTIS